MTLFDYAVLAVLAASILLGFWRGVVSEILALLAWVLAFVVARKFAPEVIPWVQSVVPDKSLQYLAAFVGLFVTVLLVMGLIRLLLSFLLRAVGMGLIDRFLGAVFGVLRGTLVVLLAVMLAGMTSLPKEEWWRKAIFAPPLETAVLAAKPWLPTGVSEKLKYR